MRLFVSGGAGHTGCNFLRLYLSDNVENLAVVLVKRTTNAEYLPKEFGDRLQVVEGDLRCDDVTDWLKGCDALMHIAHQTLCNAAAAAAHKGGVKRVFFVTTTGVFSRFNDLADGYRTIEKDIRTSDLDWTILRPTMIFGSDRDANLHKLLCYLNKHPIMPIFGSGNGLMQPVYVEDLATGLLLALKNADKTLLKEYNLSGRSPLTYNEIVRAAAKELGAQTRLVHIPHNLSLGLSIVAELLLHSRSPIKSEQVRRLSEDKAYSWAPARNDFGYNPGSFRDRIGLEIAQLRTVGLLN
jgi:nucleoside-diphosphate-sugar epimerase